MARLIDADALDARLETLKVRFKAQGRDSVADDYNFVQTVLQTAPTVDAVEVVRCGKCLYYSEVRGKDSGKPCGYGSCTKPFAIGNIVTNEDFCSFGQRGAEDGKAD